MQGYAENMIDSVLMPVADGAKHLCAHDQVAAIETVINAICQIWSGYFLRHKIKFRCVRVDLQTIHAQKLQRSR